MDLSEEAQAQHLIEWATQIAKAAYLIGYAARDDGEAIDAETDLSPLIDQIRGERHETQED